MKDAKTAILTDEQALLAIQELMSGKEWDCDTLMHVAEIVDNAGYSIEPPSDGTEGQDRESYSDDQDRDSYSA